MKKRDSVMGKRCGYTKLEDGGIVPAPVYVDTFERLSQQRRGINAMLQMVTSTAADMLAEIERQQKCLWDELCDDYGFDRRTHHLVWDGHKISATPKAQTQGNGNGEP